MKFDLEDRLIKFASPIIDIAELSRKQQNIEQQNRRREGLLDVLNSLHGM